LIIVAGTKTQYAHAKVWSKHSLDGNGTEEKGKLARFCLYIIIIFVSVLFFFNDQNAV
jgi:hypothetical protein